MESEFSAKNQMLYASDHKSNIVVTNTLIYSTIKSLFVLLPWILRNSKMTIIITIIKIADRSKYSIFIFLYAEESSVQKPFAFFDGSAFVSFTFLYSYFALYQNTTQFSILFKCKSWKNQRESHLTICYLLGKRIQTQCLFKRAPLLSIIRLRFVRTVSGSVSSGGQCLQKSLCLCICHTHSSSECDILGNSAIVNPILEFHVTILLRVPVFCVVSP